MNTNKLIPFKYIIIFAFFTLFIFQLNTQNSQAAIIFVDSTNPGANVPGVCTLRDAITAANTDSEVGGCLAGDGSDRIELGFEEIYELIEVDNNPGDPQGLPSITSEINIFANGSIVKRSENPGTPDFRIFNVQGEKLTINDISIENARVRAAAGLFIVGGELNIYNSVIKKNIAINGDGGGIGVSGGGILRLTNSTIVNNVSSSSGGGILNDNGQVEIRNCLIYDNTAPNFGSGISTGFGHVTITNSTITGNNGHGLVFLNNSEGLINNSTINKNSNFGIFSSNSNVIITNTIISNHISSQDCSGVIDSNGFNIDSDGSCIDGGVEGDLPLTDPLLQPLSDNGGPTLTHAVILGSPAIDMGNPINLDVLENRCEEKDQRGIFRSFGSACDIGAFEYVVFEDIVINENTTLNDSHHGSITIGAHNITLNCAENSVFGPLFGTGITVNNKAGVVIRDCFVRNFDTGINIFNSNESLIKSNIVSDSLEAFNISFSLDNRFLSNQSLGNENGFLLLQVSDSIFRDNNVVDNLFESYLILESNNNIFRQNKTNSLFLTSNGFKLNNSDNHKFIKNTSTGHMAGLTSNFSNNLVIRGNIFTENNLYGLNINNGDNLRIISNFVELTSDGHGIQLVDIINSKINSNNISNNLGVGLILQQSSSNILKGNTITNSSTGINLSDGSQDNRIKDNIIQSNENDGISLGLMSNNNRIIGNETSGNLFGLRIDNSDFNIIRGNSIFGNNDGFQIDFSNDNRVIKNEINFNEIDGLNIFESSNNLFRNNTANGNMNIDCLMDINSLNNNFRNNIFTINSGCQN